MCCIRDSFFSNNVRRGSTGFRTLGAKSVMSLTPSPLRLVLLLKWLRRVLVVGRREGKREGGSHPPPPFHVHVHRCFRDARPTAGLGLGRYVTFKTQVTGHTPGKRRKRSEALVGGGRRGWDVWSSRARCGPDVSGGSGARRAGGGRRVVASGSYFRDRPTAHPANSLDNSSES